MSIARSIGGILIASLVAFPIATLPMAASASPKACGEGVIATGKKKSKCVPKGLTRVSVGEGQQKRYARGDRIPRTVIYQQVSYVDYDLPRPGPGYAYVIIGEDIYLVAESTRRVVEPVESE